MSRFKEFLKSGHTGTLLTSLLYFDFCFAIWVLNGAMAPFISEEFHLSPAQKGFMVSVPVIAGALMRFPLGLLSQYIGRKMAAQVEMGMICVGLAIGYFFTSTYAAVLGMGVALGIAGASFGVALSLGSGWYPPKFKGLAMGIAGAGNSGAVLAVLFAPPLAKAFGWRSVYGISIFPMLLAMILLQIFAKEPPDREQKRLKDYLKILVDRDAWVFNLMYAVTFGGYIGLTSFLPTLFHDQYGIPKQSIGQYTAVIIIAASILRIVGGWLSDHLGGLRLLSYVFFFVILLTLAASTIPSNPWMMVVILMLCFAAMGAGNGAVFQLVPLRFSASTAVAGSLIGEIGALAGGFLPNAMGLGKQYMGSFAPGFFSGTLLTLIVICSVALVKKKWTTSWVGKHGRVMEVASILLVVLLMSHSTAFAKETDTEDANFSLKTNFHLQFQHQFLSIDGQGRTNGFQIRRGRVSFSGNAFDKNLTYLLLFEMFPGRTNIVNKGVAFAAPNPLDVYINYAFCPGLQIKGGQFKPLYSFEELVSDTKSQFIDRSITNDVFTLSRDLGVSVHGRLFEKKLDYAFFLVNDGSNLNASNKNVAPLIGGRAVYNIFGDHGYVSGDPENSKVAQWMVGVASYFDRIATAAAGDQSLIGATTDTAFRFKGLSLIGAGYLLRNQSTEKNTFGLLGQTGYFLLPQKLEATARFASVQPSGAVKGYEVGGGLGYYFKGHRLKIMTDYAALINSPLVLGTVAAPAGTGAAGNVATTGGAAGFVQGQNDHRVRTQLQLCF